jgi:hypothetical protein
MVKKTNEPKKKDAPDKGKSGASGTDHAGPYFSRFAASPLRGAAKGQTVKPIFSRRMQSSRFNILLCWRIWLSAQPCPGRANSRPKSRAK